MYCKSSEEIIKKKILIEYDTPYYNSTVIREAYLYLC